MLRNIGLVLIVLAIMFFLRPRLFLSFFGKKENPTEQVVKNTFSNKIVSEKDTSTQTELAPGFENKDIGFKPPPPKPPVEGLWKTLIAMKMDSKYDPAIDDMVFTPQFTPEIRQMNGKEIVIKGYVIPLEETGGKPEKYIMLSAYPYSSCFFCGGAGPESVMQVYPTTPIQAKKDEQITVKGKLRINEKDQYSLPYILENAVKN